jgi:hypothetical protein
MAEHVTREDAIIRTVREIAAAENKVIYSSHAKATIDRAYLLTLIAEVAGAFDNKTVGSAQ